MTLRYAIAAGIGFFLALIALKNSGLVVDHPATFVTLGDVTRPESLLTLFWRNPRMTTIQYWQLCTRPR